MHCLKYQILQKIHVLQHGQPIPLTSFLFSFPFPQLVRTNATSQQCSIYVASCRVVKKRELELGNWDRVLCNVLHTETQLCHNDSTFRLSTFVAASQIFCRKGFHSTVVIMMVYKIPGLGSHFPSPPFL